MADLLPQSDAPESGLAACLTLLAEAGAYVRAGELRVGAGTALRAAEAARAAGRPDLVAEAALVVTGVADPTVAPAVEQMCRDALWLLDGADPPPAALLGRLHGQLALALHHRERLDEAQAHVLRSEALAEQVADPLATAAALHARQLSIAGLGPTEDLLELAERMLAAAAASGSVDAELLGLGWRIDALLRQGDAGKAAHEIDSLDVLAVRTSLPLVRWNALVARAGLDQAVGRFEAAASGAREARTALPPSQRPMTEPLYVAQLMLVATDRGTVPPEIDLARSFAIGAPLIAIAMSGRFELEAGDEGRARVAYEAVGPRLAELTMDRRGLPTLTAALELAVHFGDASTAAGLAERLRPYDGLMIASALGAVGPVAYFLGLVESLLGEHDAAVLHADAASKLAVRGGYGPWLARSRLLLARAALARAGAGDLARARDSAGLAAEGARQLGMERVADRAQALVDELSGSSRLTVREREVAGLVAAGSSNREIAAALVLSGRTVETHVQNVLTKLGFHSRSQIATWAVREGIAGPDPRRRGAP